MTSIDYVSTYFPHKNTTKIIGRPTYDNLKELRNHLKANAASVTSDLGGGAHGHLGLVVPAAEYQTLVNSEYVRPVHPGALVIPANTALHEAVRLREEHQQRIQTFHEVIQVENALKTHITKTIEKIYIDELKNSVTNTITMTVPEILTFLFTRYGQVESNTVTIEEKKVRDFVYNLNDSPVIFFTAIEDLVSLAQAANLPKTKEQIIDLGITIIRNTGDFETGLTTWYAKASADHTWPNFKEHFNETYQNLIKVRGISMRGTAFQANQLITDQLNQLRNEVIGGMNALATAHETVVNNLAQPSPSTVTTTTPVTTPPLASSDMSALTNALASVNYATTTVQPAHLLPLLTQLQTQLSQLVLQNPPRNHRNRNRNQNPTTEPRTRNDISKYCWSHGACAHNGSDCRNKKPGHKDNATFANKLGGSTDFIQA